MGTKRHQICGEQSKSASFVVFFVLTILPTLFKYPIVLTIVAFARIRRMCFATEDKAPLADVRLFFAAVCAEIRQSRCRLLLRKLAKRRFEGRLDLPVRVSGTIRIPVFLPRMPEPCYTVSSNYFQTNKTTRSSQHSAFFGPIFLFSIWIIPEQLHVVQLQVLKQLSILQSLSKRLLHANNKVLFRQWNELVE